MKTFSRPGELGVEARAELEQRGQPAPGDDLALVRLQDAGDALQQRRLARAVVAEDADRGALFDVEVDVVEGDEVFERDPPEVDHPSPSATCSARGRAGSASRRADLDRGAPWLELLGEVRFAAAEHARSPSANMTIAEHERVAEVPEVRAHAPVREDLVAGGAAPGSSGCRAARRSRAGRSARSA